MKKLYFLLLIVIVILPFVFSSKTNRIRFFSLINRFNYNLNNPKESFFSVSIKDIVPCPQKSINIFFLGQSNHGNNIERKEISDRSLKNVFTYDWRLGVCSKYREPLAGVEGRAGAFGHVSSDTIFYLQNKYNYSGNVIISGFSKGGTKAKEWVKGDLANKFNYVLNNFKKNNIEIDFVLWHQGESEIKNANTIYYQDYIKDIQKIFKKVLNASTKTKIGMALVSICNSDSNEYLIKSQRSIIRNNDRVFLTLNTDNLGSNYRYDDCHFNSLGSSKIGEKYADFIYKLNN